MSIPEVGSALANPLRAKILEKLSLGPLSVKEIVSAFNSRQSTVSTHLSILLNAGLVDSLQLGREVVYRICPEGLEELADWLDAIMHAKDEGINLSMSNVMPRIAHFNFARTCYDHLAGKEGVALLDQLLLRKWLIHSGEYGKDFQLTRVGEEELLSRGVTAIPRKNSRRAFARACLDYTESRNHLGGALGASLLKALEDGNYLKKNRHSRVVTVEKNILEFFSGPQAIKKHPRLS